MVVRKKKISESRYKKLVAMEKRKAESCMLAEAPMEWRCGYGIYGSRPVEIDGKFFIEYTTGSSCD